MKRKIVSISCAAVLLTISAYVFALKSSGGNYYYASDGYSVSDSVFKSMTLEQKILQLYVYDFRQRKMENFSLLPSGFFYPQESFLKLKNDVEKFSSSSDFPLFNICDVKYPMTDLPNYMNPLAVSASNEDSEVLENYSYGLCDTLKSIGVNTLYGFPSAEDYGIIAFDDLNVKKVEKLDSLKSFLLSDYLVFLSSLNPEDVVNHVKKIVASDKKDVIKNAIDDKVSKILRIKYQYNPYSENIKNFSKQRASLISALKSVTCLKNESNFLPIKDLRDVVVIQIGGLRQNGFLTRSLSYCKPQYYYCNPKELEIKSVIKENGKKNLVFLLNCDLKKSEILTLLKPLFSSSHACVVNIDFEENLKYFQAKSLIQVFGNGFLSGDVASQAVFGGIEVAGKFPLEGFKNYKKGSFETIKPVRLQYLQETDFKKNYCDTIDSIINFAILNHCFPGCQFFVCKDSKVLIDKSYGYFTYDIDSKKVQNDDIYDIASLTKISAATILAMYLTSNNMLNTNDNLGKYFYKPIDWSNLAADTIINGKDTLLKRDIPKRTVYDVSIGDILEHRSGISPNVPVFRYAHTLSAMKRCAKNLNMNIDSLTQEQLQDITFREFYSDKYIKDSAEIRVCENLWLRNNYADTIYNSLLRLKVSTKKSYKYSDVNMILLQLAEENILNCKTDEFLHQNFYGPLGMKNTCYTPYKYFSSEKIAPTERNAWTGKYIRGDVHDPSAALLGGISGNAGLFSSAHDLGILFQMLLNKGVYGGQRFLDSLTVEKFTSKQPNTGRALGFDMVPSKYAALSASASTYGHTGFTGTCAWNDPENNIVIVFLSNRVYPEAANQKINTLKIRQKICQAVYDGLGI